MTQQTRIARIQERRAVLGIGLKEAAWQIDAKDLQEKVELFRDAPEIAPPLPELLLGLLNLIKIAKSSS